MARRKRYIRGKVYFADDSMFSTKSKKPRRIVAMNNSRNHMAVRRIFSLYDKDGNLKKWLIPIEKYPDIPKASGVERKTIDTTVKGESIREDLLVKTKTRLNKWDMRRLYFRKKKK